MNPKDLLYLKGFFDDFNKNKQRIKLVAEYRNNEYGIACDQFEIRKIPGSSLCADLNLLGNMSIESAFVIIYKTAYLKGVADSKKSQFLEQKQQYYGKDTPTRLLRLVNNNVEGGKDN